MQSVRSVLALLLLAGGCARATSTGSSSAPAAQPQSRLGDPELYAILGVIPLDSAAEVALQRYEVSHPISFLEKLEEIAEDPAAGTEARFNAVTLLGERGAVGQAAALREALTDPDPRVRAAAVVAAGKLVEKSGSAGNSVLVAALEDTAPLVQAKALELLGARDLPLLRDFLARHPTGEAATIARGLVHAGEDRGAPLESDSAGVLRRVTAGGLRLEFRPTRSWPEWGAAVGTVSIGGGTSPAVTIPDVEVVRKVVPVFFSPDETAIVYEQGRRIYVRTLQTGQVREVGAGVAPRPLPFTEEFVYGRVNPSGTGDLRERSRIFYDVLRAGFRPRADDPRFLGALETWTEMKLNGSYSPLRWIQVREQGGQFTLEGEGSQTLKLPDPFKAGSSP